MTARNLGIYGSPEAGPPVNNGHGELFGSNASPIISKIEGWGCEDFDF